ncbi:LeuD/DmdB family oxidoreductase small subunit [Sulfurospirillum multivorans]|uniref:3-isopropylmalate dehydratase small subunit n=2 Tax=Sulfurospirillum multivorans TaxID=66821 RepID=A0AA86E123_SULMK|nr:3-isopropylmalate dehydratase [Sulfurospirillum multivorans]AHJ11307.1 3-isopropylmalate dehydratase small subunit [Sulfurospirillum multivorans DSM 12446]QEH04812.1 3-isopropylmalate dehydratase small subunit [Sulfurospirillum multivorans]
MQKLLSGNAFVFGKNVDTDQIYPGRFVEFTDVEDVAKYAMFGADPEFTCKVKKGDFIVAGTNFGCGSSREHAAITLKAVGIGAIIAESFARIFYRNAINLGIPLIVCPNISKLIQTGDRLSLDLHSGEIRLEKSLIATAEPMSEYVLNILESGGIKPLIKQQLATGNRA